MKSKKEEPQSHNLKLNTRHSGVDDEDQKDGLKRF